MHFGSPPALLCLLVVPLAALLAVVARRRRGRYPVAFTNLEILAAAAKAGPSRKTAWLPLALLLVSLAFAAGALARPSVTVAQAEPHAVVVMLVDVSGSMDASDVKPNRITAATNAMRTFIQKLPGHAEVGLVEFSTDPSVVELPTSDHDEVIGALELLAPNGATAIGDGLATAVKVVQETLAREGAKREGTEPVPGGIVLLSDGAQNRGALKPLDGAAKAKAAGIRVYTIAFGTPGGTMHIEGVPGAVPVPPDPTTMRAIASRTDGHMFSAQTADEAASVYGTLGSTIARKHVRRDLTPWLSLGAGLLLIGAVGAGIALGPVVP